MNNTIKTQKIDNAKDWDDYLASLKGHPLQSALWGDARRIFDGVSDERWMVHSDNELIALIRLEKRGMGPFKNIAAWVPQGPTVLNNIEWLNLVEKSSHNMNLSRFDALITCPWKLNSLKSKRYTIWIDLSVGEKTCWDKLDKQWRYGVRRSERLGVVAEITKNASNISDFFQLCQQISRNKKFKLFGTPHFLNYLLNNNASKEVESFLFIAKHQQTLCAGAFIFRVGKQIHYIWGAVDRNYSNLRAGEFIQWQVIKWACEQGYTRYDLEGIDNNANSGVAAFKKKMGGVIVGLEGKKVYPMNWRGALIQRLIKE